MRYTNRFKGCIDGLYRRVERRLKCCIEVCILGMLMRCIEGLCARLVLTVCMCTIQVLYAACMGDCMHLV
jgi:hypothetical protein